MEFIRITLQDRMRREQRAVFGAMSLRGIIMVSYATLVTLLGEPEDGDGDGSRAEWYLEFEDGTFATIYDWRETRPIEEVACWHVGGEVNSPVLAMVAEALALTPLQVESMP